MMEFGICLQTTKRPWVALADLQNEIIFYVHGFLPPDGTETTLSEFLGSATDNYIFSVLGWHVVWWYQGKVR